MGQLLSICFGNDNSHNEHETDPLLIDSNINGYGCTSQRAELLMRKRKEKLDKVVNESISQFIDVTVFSDVRKSLPPLELVEKSQKDDFQFGNGMINMYSSDDSANAVEVISGDVVADDLKNKLEECLGKLDKQILESIIAPIANVQLTGKVYGKM